MGPEAKTAPTPQQILNTPMDDNDSGASSIGGYLAALLAELWRHGSNFSGKQPFGNSGWEGDLYLPMAKAGFIDVTLDEDGHLDDIPDEAERVGYALIESAIAALAPAAAALSGIYPSSPAPTSPYYRVGKKNARNLYQVNPDGTETHVGCMFDEHAGPLVAEALNQWEQRKQETTATTANTTSRKAPDQQGETKTEAVRLEWHYGPTESNPDPGRMWHTGCGGEVLYIDGGPICDCGAQEVAREACELPSDWRTQVTSTTAWTADEVVALVEEWQAQA